MADSNDIAKLLLKVKANTDKQDNLGRTALMIGICFTPSVRVEVIHLHMISISEIINNKLDY